MLFRTSTQRLWKENLIISSTTISVQRKWIKFWIHFKNVQKLKDSVFLRTPKPYPAALIETCVNQGRLDQAKRFCEQNWRHRVLQQRKNEHKTEVLQTDNLKWNCCFTQRHAYGAQGRSFTRTSTEKLYNQLSHAWREHKSTLKWQPVSLSCSCSPFALESTTGRRNFISFICFRK